MSIIGWVTIAEADAYFATRLNAAEVWASGTDKAAALTTAYNDLVACGEFDFSNVASGDDANPLKMAQCEQALFLLQDPSMEKRLALQAQGVTSAGIVSESYRGADSIVISPRAKQALRHLASDSGSFPIER
jgi:hypothetical protein